VDQQLLDIMDRQPGLERRRPKTRRERMAEHWVGIAMFVVWLLGQIVSGTDWLHTRESNESQTAKDLAAVRLELQKVPETYVRRDVFGEVLNNINQRLTSIDNKLAAERR
jgi:hypothetical protein